MQMWKQFRSINTLGKPGSFSFVAHIFNSPSLWVPISSSSIFFICSCAVILPKNRHKTQTNKASRNPGTTWSEMCKVAWHSGFSAEALTLSIYVLRGYLVSTKGILLFKETATLFHNLAKSKRTGINVGIWAQAHM